MIYGIAMYVSTLFLSPHKQICLRFFLSYRKCLKCLFSKCIKNEIMSEQSVQLD